MPHYFQWSHDIEEHLSHLEKVLFALKGKRVLIGADTNANSSLWGPKDTRSNPRGLKLEKHIETLEIKVLNKSHQGPTYSAIQGASYIDVTLASPSIASLIADKQWRVRDSWTTSDHNAIDIRLQVPKCRAQERGRNERTVQRQRFNTRKADWEKFVETLNRSSANRLEALPLTNIGVVEHMASTLTSVLYEACTESMPRKRRFRASNPWWTRALTKLKRKTYGKRRTYQRELKSQERWKEGDEVLIKRLRESYKVSKHLYSKTIKSAKRES